MKTAALAAAASLLAAAGSAQQLTDVAVPQADAPQSGFSSNCMLQEASFNYELARKTDGKATLFLTKKSGNAFQLCVNAEQSVFSPGLPVPGSINEQGGDLVLDTVFTKQQVPAADAVAGTVRGTNWAHDGRTYELVSRFRHHIPIARMSYPEISAASNGGSTVNLEKVAWASALLDARTRKAKSVAVRIKDDDEAEGERLVRAALALPELESSFSDAASKDTIAAFVRSELPKHKGKGLPMIKTPMIWLDVGFKKPADGEPPVVATIIARGQKAGVDARGEDIVDAMTYDELLYCPSGKKLEARAAHNLHLNRAASAAARAAGR